MTQDRAAPGVYDPLETVLYFKYCIHPGSICTPKWGTKNDVPQVPQNGVQFGVQIRVHWEKSQNLKSRGPGVKSTVNISKLEYFESFWMKIQKLKFFR